MGDDLSFERLEGGCARAQGFPIDSNPYPKNAAAFAAWRSGYKRHVRFEEKHGLRSFTCDDDTVPRPEVATSVRETPATATARPRGVGRGRSLLGPRHEWRASEVAALSAYAREGKSAPEIGEIMKRSPQAVRSKLSRMRKAVA